MLDGYLHLCRRCKRKGTPHEEKHTDCARRRCPKCGMLLWAKALPRRFRLHDTRHTTATLLLAAGVDLYAVARILRHSDPKITFETYAHLVPGYLHSQIDRLPKLEKFAALVLQEAPKALEPPRGQLLERPDSRDVLLARLAGVEPAARGFEGRCSIQLSYRRVVLLLPSRHWRVKPRLRCAGRRRPPALPQKQAHPLLWTSSPTLESRFSPSLTPGRARSRTLRFLGQVARGSGWTDAGRGGREAEGAGLLNQYTVQSCIEGSNPSLSATVRRRALSSVG